MEPELGISSSLSFGTPRAASIFFTMRIGARRTSLTIQRRSRTTGTSTSEPPSPSSGEHRRRHRRTRPRSSDRRSMVKIRLTHEMVPASGITPRGSSQRLVDSPANPVILKFQILTQSCKIHILSSTCPKITNFISNCLEKCFLSISVFKLHLCIMHLNDFHRILK